MGGGTLGENTESITGAHESAKQQAMRYKREKIDPYSSDVQGKAGELTGAAYRTVEQVPNQLAKTGKEIGEFLNPTSPKTNSDGSSSANYTNSSSKTGKSSQGSGRKADIKDQDKKNVRGKSSLYKKGPQ